MNYYENKLNYNKISFYLSDNPEILEREIHPYNEILFYIEGDGELLFATGRRRLKNNTLIIIPEDTYHFLRLENDSKFVRIKISFPSCVMENTPLAGVMSELKIFEDLNERQSYILDRMYHILKENKNNADFYTYAAFLMLVCELDININEQKECFFRENTLMTMLEEYISNNLSEDLSINLLAQRFHISPSGITHLFKNEFGISLHKFVIQKRLLYARRLVLEGKQPTKIHTEVGFRDYSSFYKAYVSFFGYPPSKEKEKINYD